MTKLIAADSSLIKFAEKRASEAVYPNDNFLGFARPKPQSAQAYFFRSNNFKRMTVRHIHIGTLSWPLYHELDKMNSDARRGESETRGVFSDTTSVTQRLRNAADELILSGGYVPSRQLAK